MKSQQLMYATSLATLLSGWLALAGPAQALAIAGPSSPSATRAQAQGSAPPVPVTSAAATPTLELVRGRIESVHPGKNVVGIAGKLVEFDADKLRVVGPDGRMASGAGALRKGMNVRFALDPASKAVERSIVLIYIER